MSATQKPIEMSAIATVRHDCPDNEVSRRRRDLVSVVEVDRQFAPALTGIAAYSHLIILFWMDRADPAQSLLAYPRGDQSLPKSGVFAMRGRNHPNPIGLAVVELLSVEDNCLTVKRLDAYNGTPVIDIKPYDDYDSVPQPRVPEWFEKRARSGRRHTTD